MKQKQIDIFYDERMALVDESVPNISKSPLKPRRLVEFIEANGLSKFFNFKTFTPFEREDFHIAHYKDYVDGFFDNNKLYSETNGLKWSQQFADSIRYTNSSLYNAILNSIKNPENVSFSPTAGFHHATPSEGMGFCTFSGQVIASTKIYRELGLTGAYLDLDGHFGNSIEDTRTFVPDLNDAIPLDCNINPNGTGDLYIYDLINKLKALRVKILKGEVHYLVFCHGADSHEWDDYGTQCSTKEWINCSSIIYHFVKGIEKEMGKPLPLTLSLFGGYRKDDYNSVLSLHLADLVECLNTLCGNEISYKPKVKARSHK